jgi:hypothetical protein
MVVFVQDGVEKVVELDSDEDRLTSLEVSSWPADEMSKR